MTLSFIQKMQTTIPENIYGTNRFEEVNKIITANTLWKKESYEHLKELLAYMIKIDASDLDIGGPRANGKAWYRTYGEKSPYDELPSYTEDEVIAMLLSVLSDDQKVILFKNKNLDFALPIFIEKYKKPYRFRGDIFYERNSLAANFRLIKNKLFKIENLGFPEQIIKRLDLQYEKSGLFLVTGITGSGKSATLDAIIDMNNQNNKAHIIIIGNPIEYVHTSKKCIITHREVGTDVLSFQKGTIEALRQDPDIIVVGEMRDSKTISTVLEVTDSGHKVFSTLHTSSTVDSIHRIIAEFPPKEQERVRYRLADTLKVVIAQKLVPNKQGGVSLAKEILSVNPSVQSAIRNNNIPEIFQMLTEGRKKGMFTLQQDLYRLVKTNTITEGTAMNFSNNRKIMKLLLTY